MVYHANYLLYFEDARIDFLDALGFSYAERIEGAGYMSPIHDIEIHYKAPLRYGEAGVVRTSIAKNLPMRTVYRQQVYRAEDVLEGEAADEVAGDPNAEGAAALGRREPQLREGATPLVDALVTVCVVERDTFKPVSLRHTFPDLTPNTRTLFKRLDRAAPPLGRSPQLRILLIIDILNCCILLKMGFVKCRILQLELNKLGAQERATRPAPRKALPHRVRPNRLSEP